MTFDSPDTETAEAVPDAPAYAQASGLAHLLFIPDRESPRFFLWGEGAEHSALAQLGATAVESLPDELLQLREIEGIAIPLLTALPYLARLSASGQAELSPSLSFWSLSAKLALDLIARQRVVPRIVKHGKSSRALSSVALNLREDHERFAALTKGMPLAAHSAPIAASSSRKKTSGAMRVWNPEGLLRAFLDIVADLLVRAANRGQDVDASNSAWPHRLVNSLRGDAANFAAEGFQERSLFEELETWVRPMLGSDSGAPRPAFRFELPADKDESSSPKFHLRFLLQAADDPERFASAADVFAAKKKSLAHIHASARAAEESLLQGLNVAARIFAPIERSLHEARPDGIEMNADSAWQFLSRAAAALGEAGMVVIVPEELTAKGQQRLRMRMHVGASSSKSGDAEVFPMRGALSFSWEARIGEETLSLRQLKEFAAMKAPLVRFHDRWVAVDRAELDQATKLLAEGGGTLTATAALAAALGATSEQSGTLPIEVAAEGPIESVLAQLRDPNRESVPVPATLRGELRPYQERGLTWLAQMSRIGIGACLADDMGLGKTIQLLAFLLYRREALKDDTRPILLTCPTSVIGNWQRELQKFAPTIAVVQHYGGDRIRDAVGFATLDAATVVITSYGLLRRDAEVLKEVDWSVIVLDEAQNIKNPESRTARVARGLPADFRVALTGTPIENRLTELWSIFEFLNPGLLGPLARFQREVAIPIERFGRNDIAERLTRIVRPLLLRRVKSDPTIIQDLPSKQEIEIYCTLTAEQAALYRAAVDASMLAIEGADGIERRGHVLALITALKQICNHPAQYLHEAGPLPQRSGKLQRLTEMLEEIIANGERVLIFTQYREMGDRLLKELKRALRTDVLFLHGGTPRAQREQMIKRFQDGAGSPRIFVLSVKAGGTGLNLTAATHVFHYDRWWNPAVEDQATDRAYRIGQHRHVQVHKFLCAGTIEEKIDTLLKTKRDLASRIVGQGEQWISELEDAELRDLFALSANAVIESESGEGENGESEAETAA